MQCVISYDVADKRRGQCVQRFLRQYARMLQYSVYLYDGPESILNHCLAGLAQKMNLVQDDIRIFPISTENRLSVAGKQAEHQSGILMA